MFTRNNRLGFLTVSFSRLPLFDFSEPRMLAARILTYNSCGIPRLMAASASSVAELVVIASAVAVEISTGFVVVETSFDPLDSFDSELSLDSAARDRRSARDAFNKQRKPIHFMHLKWA